MKILHVNKFFDLRDGVDIYMHRVMERQRAAGHEVHVLATRAPTNIPSADADRFVERMDLAKSEGLGRDFRKGLSYLWNLDAKRAMEDAIRDLRPDIIHLHNIYHHLSTSILAPIRKHRVACVQTLHDYKLACPNYKMLTEGSVCERCKGGRYFEAVRHHCLSASTVANVLAAFEMGMTKMSQSYERTVKQFICPSQFMADKMIAWGEPPSKFRVIPNPIDQTDSVAPCDGGFFLAAGRLSPEKGLDTLVRAAALAPEVKIKIAGIGPEESKLKQLALTSGATNVEFTGFLRSGELEVVRRHATALLIPSIWYENAPGAALEAMADGLPIIASRIGGLPELVTDGENGALIEAQNVEAWAQTLQQFASLSAEDRAVMGQASRKAVAERYTWSTHLAALETLYQQVQR